MSRFTHLSACLLLSVTAACSIDEPAATTSCDSLAQCPLDTVCDAVARRCVPEPTSGFLGRFACIVRRAGDAEVSLADTAEIVGRVGEDRWSFSSLHSCNLDAETQTLTLGFSAFGGNESLLVILELASALTGAVQLVQFQGGNKNTALLFQPETSLAVAYSAQGMVLLTGSLSVGEKLVGYLEVDLHAVAPVDARFGVPCPRGLADCGRRMEEIGGAAYCADFGSGPGCYRRCENNSECGLDQEAFCLSLGTEAVCTRPCASSADCPAPLTCHEFEAGSGCM